jgi:hypothetical protein
MIYTVRNGYNSQIEWDLSNTKQPQVSNYQEENNIWNNLWKIEAPLNKFISYGEF